MTILYFLWLRLSGLLYAGFIYNIYILYKSSFIGPCKSWTDARFGITQFVTPNTHIPRHPGSLSRKQKNIYNKQFW